MKQASLVQAKNHFSELIDDAEQGVSTVIHRHNRPCAVVVPLSVGVPKRTKHRLTSEQIEALFAKLATYDDPSYSAVDDLRSGRR